MRPLPLLLFATILFSVTIFHAYVDNNSDTIITNKEKALLKEAKLHFENLVNTRKWNAMYHGVYVKPVEGLEPNPYLKNNVHRCDDNRTLIKINPAWMTRQLSEIETIENLHFSITSLRPINPANAPDAFEKEGLTYIERHGTDEYYRFDASGNDFHYIGALHVTQACLACHSEQGYHVGDVRGGIHIALTGTDMNHFLDQMSQRKMMVLAMAYGLGFALLLAGAYAYRKQRQTYELNRSLESKVIERTQSLRKKQSILQEMLDRQPDAIVLMEGTRVIDSNKSMLDHCGIAKKEQITEGGCTLDDLILPLDRPDYLQPYMEGVHWSDYILDHGGTYKLRLNLPDGAAVFRVSGKLLETFERERLKLISLSDITQHEELVENLTHSAFTDALTGIYNRKKFDDELSSCLSVTLDFNVAVSLIMIDIDFFKNINDNFGHAAGDRLLQSFTTHITSLLREEDFFARWGGEEFVIILHHTTAEHALKVAEKLRRGVETHTFDGTLQITASFGVTQAQAGESPLQLIERVDKALYRAKHEGRNRVNLL